jgi:MFS transporter, NRE family, putaive nickel resistance protein
MPYETLIAENIDSPDQGKVYGSHFAFSHVWWAFAYPVAGYLGTQYDSQGFFYG